MAEKGIGGIIAIILIIAGLFYFFGEEKETISDSALISDVSVEKAFSAISSGKNIIYSESFFPIFATQADYVCKTCPSDPNTDCCYLPSLGETWDNTCADLCPKEEEEIPTETCPDGFIDVGSGKCCPSAYPYYCSQNNLCYGEPNCGASSLGEVVCKTDSGGSYLTTQELSPSCAPCVQCVFGGNEGAGSCVWNGDPNGCLCDYPSWNANIVYLELQNLLGIDNTCESCSGNLCVRSNECQIGELRCIGTKSYRTCESVTHQYFASQFNLLATLQFCPENTICNVNRCEVDSDGDGFPNSLDQCPNNEPNIRVDKFGCPIRCTENEVKLADGTCKQLKQTCIDNNLNNICDPDDPIVWADPENNVPICADRDGNRVCDGVESLFCKDSNENSICDSDEVKWLATHCEDINGNGICDGIENERTDCSLDFAPVCDISTDITYPSQCFADAFDVVETIEGACDVEPIIIRRDCATGDVPIPSGYICDFETGWLFKKETIYQDVFVDCRISEPLEGFECIQVGEDWVWTRTELVEIDCYSRGCPKDNQICQAGICLESQARCPDEIDCKETYGIDAVCDEETGLCVTKQYFPIEVIKEVIVEVPVEEEEGIPTIVKVIGIIGGLFLLLKLFDVI